MLKNIADSIHRVRFPFPQIKERFTRYVLITACTGALSFGIALALLHSGMLPLLALIISALASGIFNYGAMELWAFPHREGRLSWNRLIQNALVGVGGFSARVVVLHLGLAHIHVPYPLDKAVPLALAYLTSFAVGYILRTRVVFK